MKLAFLGVELLPVVILVVVAVLIKYKKAYWLISGYNTMSAEKKKNVDIEGLANLAVNLCFVIAGIILAASLFVYLRLVMVSLGLFLLIIPVAIYSVIKAQKYDGNTRNSKGKMKTSTKVIIAVVCGFLILVGIGVGVLINYSSKPAEYTHENGVLKISGMYGREIRVNEISKLELKDTMPEVLNKSNGSDTGKMKKGYFDLKDRSTAILFVDVSRSPFVYLWSNSRLIILNCEDGEKTKELYGRIEGEWKKGE